ncbi:peptide-methionine (R)-S-oxide reductase MsrB [Roseicyclus persicicus]|nr:peptide-methionine (R)-S-oxide reductase MsrB [Roseibacterium persicicum]
MLPTRRHVLTAGLAALILPRVAAAAIAEGPFAVTRSAAEWRAMLTPTEYAVMREGETERAGSSPLNAETRPGVYHCRGCDQALYDAAAKYDSGTGWPSFFDVRPGAIGTMQDRSFFITRTECHCSRCGSHLGHIFDDGPQPTGLRHCLNGVALVFRPA